VQAYEIRFHSVLADLIKAERSREAQHLADGKAADWADYNKRVGILEGLARARDLADRLATETLGREQDTETFMEKA
jgi:hypothetical protein